jgi:hypothetical protein
VDPFPELQKMEQTLLIPMSHYSRQIQQEVATAPNHPVDD